MFDKWVRPKMGTAHNAQGNGPKFRNIFIALLTCIVVVVMGPGFAIAAVGQSQVADVQPSEASDSAEPSASLIHETEAEPSAKVVKSSSPDSVLFSLKPSVQVSELHDSQSVEESPSASAKNTKNSDSDLVAPTTEPKEISKAPTPTSTERDPETSKKTSEEVKASAPGADELATDSSHEDNSTTEASQNETKSLALAAAACESPVAGSQTVAGFELDGNLCVNSADDWASVPGQPVMNDGYGSNDSTQFTQGAAESNWPWSSNRYGGSGSNLNDSTDLGNIYATQRTHDGDVFTFFGFERIARNTGTVQFTIELNAKGNNPANSPVTTRSENDLRLLIQQNGNSNLDFVQAYKWSSGQWIAIGKNGFAGAINTAPIQSLDGRTIDTGMFAEVAINLSALFGPANCSGNYGWLNVRSNTAANDTSSLKDWVRPTQLDVPSTCSDLTVDKEWVIDGQTFKDGQQPEGFDAELTISGVIDPEFGTSYSERTSGARFEAGQTVTIGESDPVIVPAGCVNVPKGNIGDFELSAGANRYKITNTVTCTHLTLVKEVKGGSAVPGDWTLTATGPDTVSGRADSDAVTNVRIENGTYVLSEAGTAAKYQQTALKCDNGTLTGDSVEIAQGTHVICTFTNTVEIDLQVNKSWKINGDAYDNGKQPIGEAGLSVDGQTDPKFGDVLTGNLLGDEVGISEKVSGLPATCTVTSTFNGQDVTIGEAYKHTMVDGDTNVVNVVNTVICTQKMTLVKQVNNEPYGGELGLDPDQWTLTASKDSQPVVTGKHGSDDVKNVEVETGTFTLSEAGPQGYEQEGSWTCEGADVEGDQVKVELGDTVTCTVVNKALPGSVTWTKVDSVTKSPLPGSEWTVTYGGKSFTVVDCDDAPCAAETDEVDVLLDQDPAAGSFKLDGLSWGDYELTESVAPPGYVRSDAVHEFTITNLDLERAVDLKSIENVQVTGPDLPLTGGIGRDHIYLLGGLVLAIGTSVLGVRGFLKRRTR